MAAGVIQKTLPYCRACGWDYVLTNDRGSDLVCDSCGDDLTNSGSPAGLAAPTNPGSTPGAADVTFTWTSNPEADSDESRFSVDGDPFSSFITDTSPTSVAGSAGDVIAFEVRSVVDTVQGGAEGPVLKITDTVTP